LAFKYWGVFAAWPIPDLEDILRIFHNFYIEKIHLTDYCYINNEKKDCKYYYINGHKK